MRADCAVYRSEGFASLARVQVSGNGKSVIATVNVVQADELLGHGEAGLSTVAWAALGASAPCAVTISHPDTVESFAHVRAKLFGHVLQDADLDAIVRDVSNRRYSDVQLSALLAGCAGERMTSDEVVALTRAMVSAGDRLDWGRAAVFDKHCVGGLPGNRATPIVVAIVVACGLVIPETSCSGWGWKRQSSTAARASASGRGPAMTSMRSPIS
jgi:thymidine phosphorylase